MGARSNVSVLGFTLSITFELERRIGQRVTISWRIAREAHGALESGRQAGISDTLGLRKAEKQIQLEKLYIQQDIYL